MEGAKDARSADSVGWPVSAQEPRHRPKRMDQIKPARHLKVIIIIIIVIMVMVGKDRFLRREGVRVRFAKPLIQGTLLRRYKRFLADIRLAEGQEVTAHCPNPGAMLGLNAPGSEVWLAPADNPKRKLAYTWELVRADGVLVGLHASRPNALVAEALQAGRIEPLTGYATCRSEVRYGERSRIDLLLQDPARRPCYVEIKNVHLRRQAGLAEFPDCRTARGARHMQELARMVEEGARAVVLFAVQRPDCDRFTVAADLDPGYAQALQQALARGVEVLCYRFRPEVTGIELEKSLPVTI